MKTTRLFPIAALAAAFVANSRAQDAPAPAPAKPAPSVPLWPEGATPHANEKDAETGKPKLHLYPAPEDSRNGCAVVVCPGGGYGGLAADHEGHQIAQWLNGYGISAYVLHYRLGPEGHHFPTQLADVQRALRLVRSRAKEDAIDDARVGVMGFSAGGHLASMAATKFDEKAYEPADAVDEISARPSFAVLCYPVIAMGTEHAHAGSRKNLLGGDFAPESPEAQHVSSELNVTAATPPTFIFQTDEDTVVPAENAVLFYLALRKHHIPAELHIYRPGPHGVGLFLGDPVLGTWPNHLYDWMRLNGFLVPGFQRVAVSGEVTLDGTPISWGSVTFHPENPNLPETTLRIHAGKFSGNTETGPPPGDSQLSFSGSIWEATQNPDDRVIQIDRLSPEDAKPVNVEVKPGLAPLKFDIRTR
ncbi:MAG: alpha/beta hydrolase [Akkermansiaceae bacterium]|nr:alpha/beta hydrolase [Akkermansiaceae bacterium]MCP5550296.1 alpha/beta hydrolase [Akkermansiaceae bacterium]